jgi:hypothetical protein
MSATSRHSLAAGFISNNFSLFGFGSVEQALLQSVKELVDNALDSIRVAGATQSSGSKHEIHVQISSDRPDAPICLDVSDTGCGVREPEAFLKYFSTDKLASTAAATTIDSSSRPDEAKDPVPAAGLSGRFGLGLSVCLLYAALSTDGEGGDQGRSHRHALRLVTRTEPAPPTTQTETQEQTQAPNADEASAYLVAYFGIDIRTGQPILLQKAHVSAAGLPPQGTSVEVYIRRPPQSTMPAVLQAIRRWLARLAALPGSIDVNIRLSCNISGSASAANSSSDLPRGDSQTGIVAASETFRLSKAPSPADEQTYAAAVSDATSATVASLRLRSRSRSRSLPQEDSTAGFADGSRIDQRDGPLAYAGAAFGSRGQLQVRVSAVLFCSAQDTAAALTPAIPLLPIAAPAPLDLGLGLWRYVNGVPVLDDVYVTLPASASGASTGEDQAPELLPEDCALVAGVRGVRWQRFGVALRGGSGAGMRLECAQTGCRAAQLEAPLMPNRLRLSVDLCVGASALQWAGLSKRAVSEPAGGAGARGVLAALVARTAESALHALHARLQDCPRLATAPAVRDVFLTQGERNQRLLRSRNVPALGEALSRLLARLPPDDRQRIVRELGLEEDEREGEEEDGDDDDEEEAAAAGSVAGLAFPVTNAVGELEGGAEISSRRIEMRLQQLLLLGLDQRNTRGREQGQG